MRTVYKGYQFSSRILDSRPVMGKLFKEGAKGKEKNFRRANIIYYKNNNDTFYKILVFFVILSPIND